MKSLNKYLLVFFSMHLTMVAWTQEIKDSSKWQIANEAYYYIVPSNKNTITVLGYADYKRLHLEARYNYEDERTGSVFAGWRFNTNGKLEFEAIPIFGFVFGNTNGIAPGLELDLRYKKFHFYSESEYMIDFEGKENNFLYTWGELTINPFKTLDIGISYQRTFLYQTKFEVQRGFMTKYSIGKFTAGIFYFNPFSSSSYLITSLAFDW